MRLPLEVRCEAQPPRSHRHDVGDSARFRRAATFAQQQPATTIAITHAKIFTLAGPPIEDGVLVIKDGKIAAVGTNVDVPSGAQVIDGKGLAGLSGIVRSGHADRV